MVRLQKRGCSLLAGALLVLVAGAPAAGAVSGQSTPGAVVAATNSGSGGAASDLRITLAARSERSTVAEPSCRPQDLTLRCWGSLVLRVPERGGLTLIGLEVHRVAVGDIGCDDDHDDGDHDEGDGCGGHEGEVVPEVPGAETGDGVQQAQVNGVTAVRDPGDTGLAVGAQVQVKITLTDNGPEIGDQVDIQLNEFVPGPVKPLLYQSGPQAVRQVRIQLTGTSA